MIKWLNQQIQRMVISGGNFKPERQDALNPNEVASLLLEDQDTKAKRKPNLGPSVMLIHSQPYFYSQPPLEMKTVIVFLINPVKVIRI